MFIILKQIDRLLSIIRCRWKEFGNLQMWKLTNGSFFVCTRFLNIKSFKEFSKTLIMQLSDTRNAFEEINRRNIEDNFGDYLLNLNYGPSHLIGECMLFYFSFFCVIIFLLWQKSVQNLLWKMFIWYKTQEIILWPYLMWSNVIHDTTNYCRSLDNLWETSNPLKCLLSCYFSHSNERSTFEHRISWTDEGNM